MPRKLSKPRQQGIKYSEDQRQEIIQSIRPFLELDYDLKKSCMLADVPYTTVHTWVKKDNALRIKIGAWRNRVGVESRRQVSKSVFGGNTEDAKWWLKYRDKEDFSERREVSGPNGDPIQVIKFEVDYNN